MMIITTRSARPTAPSDPPGACSELGAVSEAGFVRPAGRVAPRSPEVAPGLPEAPPRPGVAPPLPEVAPPSEREVTPGRRIGGRTGPASGQPGQRAGQPCGRPLGARSRRPHGCAAPAPPSMHGSRLTRRGRVVVALAWMVLVVLAALPFVAREPGTEVPGETVSVRIEPGDTLWSVAREIDATADPRPLVDTIVELNDLGDGGDIEPGDVLRVPASGG
ncbi:LysM peptidoglycan-binding domain-containing protein [Actinobacteria bacterium YIM 96077]|uniref:LysM domain-containing protein n=1 Tax=Phytoactinopolyspora halophila TaxID=1981511 RepID=A0A329R0C6_9ACTN|nr:LysM peptidoglycan-binding domain-containing protein [Phytoactinopolyspora halophila]AYY12829.1 LysM peptidoglycan-binding domain-containing protein [Actinobacteria bacterium YIM 96077]RAW16378.1 hypothetical protein DPM12_07015 [Phytoactinopolyspora halophila]